MSYLKAREGDYVWTDTGYLWRVSSVKHVVAGDKLTLERRAEKYVEGPYKDQPEGWTILEWDAIEARLDQWDAEIGKHLV